MNTLKWFKVYNTRSSFVHTNPSQYNTYATWLYKWIKWVDGSNMPYGFCRPFELKMSVFASGCVFLQKNISSFNLWHCKRYRHKSRDLREINRDMHRMFVVTDLCIIRSYWCIIILSKQLALLNKNAHSHKYLLFHNFIKQSPLMQC